MKAMHVKWLKPEPSSSLTQMFTNIKIFDHLHFCLKIILNINHIVFQRKYSCLKYQSLGEFANNADMCAMNCIYIFCLKEGYKALGCSQATLRRNPSCHWFLWFQGKSAQLLLIALLIKVSQKCYDKSYYIFLHLWGTLIYIYMLA